MSHLDKEIKMIKTGFMLSLITSLPNLILKSDDADNIKLGVFVLISAEFYQRGKQRRAGSNTTFTLAQTLFPTTPLRDTLAAIDNGISNVINGGAACFDDTVTKITQCLSK